MCGGDGSWWSSRSCTGITGAPAEVHTMIMMINSLHHDKLLLKWNVIIMINIINCKLKSYYLIHGISFLGLSQILRIPIVFMRRVCLSITFSTMTSFALLECTLNFTYRLIMSKAWFSSHLTFLGRNGQNRRLSPIIFSYMENRARSLL